MPRQPAQPPPARKYCRTEFHPDAEAYLKDLADDTGVQVGYIIRLCVAKSLPEIEAILRSGEEPHDELKRPTKPLKTTVKKSRQTPDYSKEPPPPIAVFAETGEMPAEPESEPLPEPLPPREACEPEPGPEPKHHRQVSERPTEPAAPPAPPPAPDSPDADLTLTTDPLQQKLRRVGKMRRG